MGRKNANVGRKNARRDRREKGVPRMKVTEQPRVRVEELVLPDGQCLVNPRRPKARFETKDKAEKALAQAQRERARRGSTHVEKRVYRCLKGGCDGWHLTSRESYQQMPKRKDPK